MYSDPNMSDTTLLVSVEDLISRAMGPPDVNVVNFKLIQMVLQILARQQRMLSQRVEIKITELAAPRPPLKISSGKSTEESTESSSSKSPRRPEKRHMAEIKEEREKDETAAILKKKIKDEQKEKERAEKIKLREKEKAEKMSQKEQEKAGKIALKEQEKAGKIALKEQERAEKIALKEQEKAGKIALKEQEKAGKIVLKEQERAEKIALKEQEKAGKIALKEQEKAGKIALKEQEKADKVTQKEQEKAVKTAQKEQEKEVKTAQKEQEKAEKVALKEQEKAEKVALKEQEKAEKAALKEQEKAQKGQEKAEKAALKEQEKAEHSALKEQEKAQKEQEKAEKAALKEQEKAEHSALKEQEKAVRAQKEQEKAEKAAVKEQEKAEKSALKEQEKAQKGQEKAEKAALKEQEKADKAQREQERAEKAVVKEQEKAEKAALKEQEKADKAQREQERAEKAVVKEQEKAEKAALKEQEKADKVQREQERAEKAVVKEQEKAEKAALKEQEKADKVQREQERAEKAVVKEQEKAEKAALKEQEKADKAQREQDRAEKAVVKEQEKAEKAALKEQEKADKARREQDRAEKAVVKEQEKAEKAALKEQEKADKAQREQERAEKRDQAEKEKAERQALREKEKMEKMTEKEKEKYLKEVAKAQKEAEKAEREAEKEQKRIAKEQEKAEKEIARAEKEKERERSRSKSPTEPTIKQKKADTRISITESMRGEESIIVVEKGPTTRSDSRSRTNIDVVTQSQFALLEAAVRQLKDVAVPKPLAMPDNKKLMSDLAKGTASLPDTMQAMQVGARVKAAETAIDRMTGILTQLAAAGALPDDLADQVETAVAEAEVEKTKPHMAPKKSVLIDPNLSKAFRLDARPSVTSRLEDRPSMPSSMSIPRPSQTTTPRPSILSRQSTISMRPGVTHEEMNSALRDLRDEMSKNLQGVLSRATMAADNALHTAMNVANKLDVALKLDLRISSLFTLVSDYAEQLSGFDAGLTTQMQSFKDQIGQMRTDLQNGLALLENVNNNAETAAVMELTERYTDLVGELDTTLSAHNSLQRLQGKLGDEMHSLVECVEMLREQKCDKDEVLDGLRDKADISRLAGLLSEAQFATARGDFERRLDLCHEKFRRQDAMWTTAIKDLTRKTDQKAELIDLLSLRDLAQKQLQELHDRLRALAFALGEPKAALLTRLLSRGASCGACGAAALMEPQDANSGAPPRLPPLRAPPEPEPCARWVTAEPPLDRHTCHRWVGGSHTLLPVGGAAGREGTATPSAAIDEHRMHKYTGYGDDGRLYMMEEELKPCIECNTLSENECLQPAAAPGGDGGAGDARD